MRVLNVLRQVRVAILLIIVALVVARDLLHYRDVDYMREERWWGQGLTIVLILVDRAENPVKSTILELLLMSGVGDQSGG